MRTHRFQQRPPGVGIEHRHKLRIIASFDPQTFSEVRKYALQGGVSMAESIRQLVEDGLETRKMARG